MKKRSRELHVFSISALDLFASALGAFVLLTVIFLPFVSTIGGSSSRSDEQGVADVRDDSEVRNTRPSQATSALQSGQEGKAITLPHIDLVIAMDTTASMKEEIALLQDDVSLLASILSTICPSFAMGIVDFKDPTDVPSIRTHRLRIVSGESSRSAVQRFVNSMVATSNPGNQEPEEGISDALKMATIMPWRDVAERRIIVVISDEAAIDEGRALQLAAEFAGRAGNKVSTVVASHESGSNVQDFMSRLAREGKGTSIRATESMIGTILEAIIESPQSQYRSSGAG